ncbi:MAG: HD domain-containing protein [Gemmatimonadetes bacterium]|nr:HD domain-containing protein [Gemmatimonadota bacterium]MCB9505969.1 HD domain-containing protein [Gemmatimonadales bacterium]MCA9761958.1 HD domain-containing protein [Gemmatimonadota bacterium]MCA9768413.1 HD domain-containing protein [Gemmatimonadota bacterium]MCB9518528.1 HD domain-containing protein [Gemmatimonadales bacterium]
MTPQHFDVIRDPLWDNIRIEPEALACLDTEAVQRLRYVRQLGHAFLVYPGATHSRFEHALGAYHLARRALTTLGERGDLDDIEPEEQLAVRLAALLHDIGHYPFSHALEEAGFPHHEGLGAARLRTGGLGQALRAIGGEPFIERVAALIEGRSASPLAGLVSGSLDLDKIDYLSRDARNCGVPYGTLDTDRLLASLCLVATPDGGREVGVHEKGISALESLLFAKYQMYRNVYWHHAVRSATCMFKRAVRATVRTGAADADTLAAATDDSLSTLLAEHDPTGLARALRQRALFKRTVDLPASEVPDTVVPWLDTDPDRLEQAEDAVAGELGLGPDAVLIDYPSRTSMLGVDLPLLTRDGRVERLTDEGRVGQLGLPRIARELYLSARRLRMFTRVPVKLSGLPRTLSGG